MDGKYIVFKREDWDNMPQQIRGVYENHLNEMARKAVPDAVVIRRQDAFASAALHTYANSIGVAAKCIGMLSPDVSKRLMGIADYFHEQAIEADDTDTKLPD